MIWRNSKLDVIQGYILEENITICLENILSSASCVLFFGLGAEVATRIKGHGTYFYLVGKLTWNNFTITSVL